MGNKIELLAPAGDWEAFLAAVENGADAIYLGGRLFNARQFAGNFDSEQLKKAIDYAHVRDARVYLAMNTLIADDEMKEAVAQAEEAYTSGIDGIIVQDLGLARLVRKIFPGLDLHASTQMTVYNLEGVRVLEELGFKRAVLARELTLEEIRHITQNTKLEIEVFIHGALCISYSGQCLMSSIIGGRSGNRGKCAQPCRLPYDLVHNNRTVNRVEGRYLLSPKDLCSIEILDEVMAAGVKSLKIEGRMKNPEYVATVVGTYRKYIDARLTVENGSRHNTAVEGNDVKRLTQIFNRGGFSRGYLQGKCGKDMMCYEKPKNWGIYLGEVLSYDRMGNSVKIKMEEPLALGDGIEIWNGEDENPGTVVTEIKVNRRNVQNVNKGQIAVITGVRGRISKGNKVYKTSDKQLITAARETFTGRAGRKAPVEGRITIAERSPVTLWVKDPLGNEVRADSGAVPEKAINRPLTKEKVLEQLNKTGATPFKFVQIEVEMEEGLSVPVSVLNDLRRNALEELERKKAGSRRREMSDEQREIRDRLLYFPGNSRKKSEKLKISLLLYQWNRDVDYQNLEADRIYVPLNAYLDGKSREMLEQCRKMGKEVYVWLPSITRGNYDRLIGTKFSDRACEQLDGILIGNVGSLEHVKELKSLKTAGDYTLNIFNSFSLRAAEEIRLREVTLSPELTLSQIGNMAIDGDMAVEAVAYGRIPLMTSEYCPVGSTAGGFTGTAKCSGICEKGEYYLKDRMGMLFPVLCDRIDCRSTLFNANVLFVPDILDKLRTAGVHRIRLNITDESSGEMKELVALYRDVAENGQAALNRHKEVVERVKSKGFTRGHYFRGV